MPWPQSGRMQYEENKNKKNPDSPNIRSDSVGRAAVMCAIFNTL
jgi:hypothetical protein